MIFVADALKQSVDASEIALIVSNLIPLYGVLFLKWTVFSVLILYWLESAVIGFYNILKMYVAGSFAPPFSISGIFGLLRKIPLILFFMVHYGGFMLIHGLFIFVIFGSNGTFSIPLPQITFKGYEAPLISIYKPWHIVLYQFFRKKRIS